MSPSRSSHAPHSAAPAPKLELLLILGALTAFSPLSVDMYLPAFPAIGHDLHATTESVQHTLALFFLGMAAGQLFYGPLSDRFGRRKPLLGGLSLYIAASVGCATTRSIEWLTFWRLLQGFGGCAGIVIARAVVRDRFDQVHAAHVLSQLALVMGIAPILAPFLGGQLLLWTGWRAIFWVLTAFGILCALAAAWRLEETWGAHPASAHPLQVARVFGEVLRDRTYLLPTLTVAFSQSAMFIYIMASPGVFIKHFGVAPDHFGFFFGANALGLIAATQINRWLLRRHFPYRILHYSTCACALAGALILMLGWTGWGGLWGMAGALFALLVSLGFVGANGTACALANQGHRAGSASALLGTLQFTLSSALGGLSAHAVTWPIVATPVRAMSMFIAASVATAWIIHLCGIDSKTEKLGAWMRQVTRRRGRSGADLPPTA